MEQNQSRYKYLLSKSQFGSFSYNFAKIVGIQAAAYFSELYEQYQASEKEFFTPKYTKLQELLHISKEEQESYIGAFKSLKIVEQQDKLIKINSVEYIKIILNDSEDSIAELQKVASESSTRIIVGKAKKSDAIRDRLKYQVLGNDEETRKLYFKWIDALVDRYGPLPNETVIMGQRQASNAAHGDARKERAIIEKAIINVWKDMTYAIDVFNKTMTIEGNYASAKPITLSQPVENEQPEDDEVTFEEGSV